MKLPKEFAKECMVDERCEEGEVKTRCNINNAKANMIRIK